MLKVQDKQIQRNKARLPRRKKLKNVKIVDTVERALQFTQRGYQNQYQKRTIQKNQIE